MLRNLTVDWRSSISSDLLYLRLFEGLRSWPNGLLVNQLDESSLSSSAWHEASCRPHSYFGSAFTHKSFHARAGRRLRRPSLRALDLRSKMQAVDYWYQLRSRRERNSPGRGCAWR